MMPSAGRRMIAGDERVPSPPRDDANRPERWVYLAVTMAIGAVGPRSLFYCARTYGSGCAILCASAALIDKFDAAGISVPPHHAAIPCRFEAIQ